MEISKSLNYNILLYVFCVHDNTVIPFSFLVFSMIVQEANKTSVYDSPFNLQLKNNYSRCS